MFDTMTLTKVVGGFCGAFLVFLLGGFLAELIYEPAEGHAEGEEVHQAYVIPVAEGAGAAEGPSAEEIAAEFEAAYAGADATAGQNVFRACQGCHAVVQGQNGTGPYLYGVVGRPVDSAEGYDYSGALLQVADVWDPLHLSIFLTNPKAAAPGTKMGFNGLRDVQDRADVIAYLDSLDG